MLPGSSPRNTMSNIRIVNTSFTRQVVRLGHGENLTIEPGASFQVPAEIAKALLKMEEKFKLWIPGAKQRAQGKHPGGSADALAQLGLGLSDVEIPSPEPMRRRMKTKPVLEHATKGLEVSVEGAPVS